MPLKNLMQFDYIPDVLLNLSSLPPMLPYTGEELRLQVENLTQGASIHDIELFIGCSSCQLKSFTSKGITCQPPAHLPINPPLLLNNQQQPGQRNRLTVTRNDGDLCRSSQLHKL